MQLAETELDVHADIVFVPHLDRLTLAFSTICQEKDIGMQQWDFRFPVQMTADEARELAGYLITFANHDADNVVSMEKCDNCDNDIHK